MHLQLLRLLYLLPRKHINEIILGIFLFFSLIIRIANFSTEAVYANPDGNSYYIVANHIVKYGEWPLVGASTGYTPELKKSPIWYYFLATLLLIKNDILFLGWVNIFLSLLTILAVYILTRIIFDKNTALIAAVLFSFSDFSYQQAIFYIWDAFTAQNFVILSLLIFILSARKNNYLLLLTGIVIYVLACAIYLSSGLFILPAIIFLILYILKKRKRQLRHFIGAFGVLVGVLLVVHLPVFIYSINNNITLDFLKPRKGLIAPVDFLPELFSLFYIFWDSYFLNLSKNILSLNNFLFLTVMGALMNTFLALKRSIKREYYLLILAFILNPLVIIAVFQLNRPFYDPQTMPIFGLLRYFLASIVLFIILIADAVNYTFSRNYFLRIIQILIIITLIHISFPSLSDSLNNLSGKLYQKRQLIIKNNPAVGAIEKEIYNLKKEEHFSNFNFFQIITFARVGSKSFVYDAPSFWVSLERDLNSKLVKIDNKSIWTYKPIGGDQIIFLICQGYSSTADEKNECVEPFKNDRADYSIIKQIYSGSPYSIHLSKKIPL